jgi:hypothetical protein
MSFLPPVCLPVLPPSTTSLSSWKNWLTTVCLCSVESQQMSLLCYVMLDRICRHAVAIGRISAPLSPLLSLQTQHYCIHPTPTHKTPLIDSISKNSPSTSATLYFLSTATLEFYSSRTRQCVDGKHLWYDAQRTRGSCMRQTGFPGAKACGTVVSRSC